MRRRAQQSLPVIDQPANCGRNCKVTAKRCACRDAKLTAWLAQAGMPGEVP